ncbi:protein FAM174C isoform X2 [Electrophorus electricus]|uniref:protein FAM174C isoform X1 n=1 Tax=Electrophorus electricus TaxID=8005 RepID=UPI0015D0778F|nr:protein FAM174C isoform X1 [Electrophorus electricus]XP_026852198.2 protein FAM174C isoform X2 [Electrophorus electricus]
MKLRALVSVCFLVAVSLAEDPKTPPVVAPERVSSSTVAKGGGNFTLPSFELDVSMVQRALYVLIGITVIGLLYFLVRAVRLKKTTTQRKKYGLLSNYDDTVEMAQLESDEEDTTVYEAKSLRR